MFRTVPMAWSYVHRQWEDTEIADLLWNTEWPEIVVDHKWAELIPLAAKIWPDVKFAWVIRDARATVASMVAKDWYNPRDDEWPPVMFWWWETPQGHKRLDANYRGHRTRPDRLGQMDQDQWLAMPQPERCCWWWQHATRLIAQELSRLEAGRWWAGKLEGINTVSLCKFAGVPVGVMPHEGQTGAVWDEGWEPYWDVWCKELAETLGYS
jgi:hypothetical protein